MLKPGTGFLILDPAAAVAKELSLRDDCTFGVAHPCHPSFLLDQDTPEARADRFGGDGGKQDIVMSKICGEDNVSFLVGHIYNLTCNFLGYIPGKPPVSDACKVAIGLGNRLVMREDWKKIWDDDVLHKVIKTMLHPEQPQI